MIMRLASATKTFNFQSVSHKQLISKIERKKANNNVVGVENTIKICMHNTFFHFHSTDFFAFFHFLFINWGGYLENSDLFKCTGIPPCQNISINERPQILPVQKTKTAIAAVSCFFNKVSVKRKKRKDISIHDSGQPRIKSSIPGNCIHYILVCIGHYFRQASA